MNFSWRAVRRAIIKWGRFVVGSLLSDEPAQDFIRLTFSQDRF
jgi:hypothetical protein